MSKLDKLAKEYWEQDNCGTAYPVFWQIQDINWVASYHFSDGDRYTLVYDGETYLVADTLQELFEKIKKDEDDIGFEMPEMSYDYICESDCDEFVELNEYVSGIFAQEQEYVLKGMFLFMQEAKDHLKANHYHYSSKARVYCSHAWRAPKTEQLLRLIKESPNE